MALLATIIGDNLEPLIICKTPNNIIHITNSFHRCISKQDHKGALDKLVDKFVNVLSS